MDIKNFENKFKNFNGKIYFNYSLKKLNWFNIGGNTKIYFKPSSLNDLIKFLKLYGDNNNLFVLGAGSNVLFDKISSGKVKVEIYKKYQLKDIQQAHIDLEARKIIGPAVIVP